MNPDVLEKQDLVHQGESAERIAQKWGISREDLDAFATESHRRASAAAREGMNKEILPTPGLDPDGNQMELTTDEGIRHNIDAGKMASLKTVFRPEGEGVVTAGNSSQLTDGASSLLVGDREVAETDDFTPRARFVARVAIGEDPVMQLTGVIPRSSFSPSGYRWSLKRPCPTWIQCPAPDGSAAEDGRRRGKSRHYWSVL